MVDARQRGLVTKLMLAVNLFNFKICRMARCGQFQAGW